MHEYALDPRISIRIGLGSVMRRSDDQVAPRVASDERIEEIELRIAAEKHAGALVVWRCRKDEASLIHYREGRSLKEGFRPGRDLRDFLAVDRQQAMTDGVRSDERSRFVGEQPHTGVTRAGEPKKQHDAMDRPDSCLYHSVLQPFQRPNVLARCVNGRVTAWQRPVAKADEEHVELQWKRA
jgi:hypothetical protein